MKISFTTILFRLLLVCIQLPILCNCILANSTHPDMTAGYREDGLRAWKEVAGKRTYFLYSGTTLLAELSANGTVDAYDTWSDFGLIGRTDLTKKTRTMVPV